MTHDNIASPPSHCVIGGYLGNGDRSADILEYTHGDAWSKIGTMRDARYEHATSIIEFKKFEEYCN